MKIQPAQADGFIKKPAPEMRAILVYGPDQGLVLERVNRLRDYFVDDPNDPFRLGRLTGDEIIQDPSRFFSEATSAAFGGGIRVIMISSAKDAMAKIMQEYSANTSSSSVVIIAAGELTPRSALRKLFESHKQLASVACYADNSRNIAQLIQTVMKENRVNIDNAAQQLLMANLGADRGHSMRELEKLVLYAGAGGTITVDAVTALLSDAGSGAYDKLNYAMTAGDATTLERELMRLFHGGAEPVGLLRAALNHLMKVRDVALMTGEEGLSPDEAIARLKPPVFYDRKLDFIRIGRMWNSLKSARALLLLEEAEKMVKTTAQPAQAITERVFHQIAAIARRS